MKFIEQTLLKLGELVQQGRYEEIETDRLELKPTPSLGEDWRERQKTVNAFLNSRGGILLLGVKEKKKERYELTGYREDAEPKIKELNTLFTDNQNRSLDLTEYLHFEIKEALDKRVGVLYVEELPAEKKFCFFRGSAWKRVITGEHKITKDEIERQEELKEELIHARELAPVPGAGLEAADLDSLNEYIALLNRQIKVETLKTSMDDARAFLERKQFFINNTMTTLGMLVCGRNPEDHLGFRCQVHGYVSADRESRKIIEDRKIIQDNILPVMERSFSYILQNIPVAIRPDSGGRGEPDYPEEVLRETVNNALAHRDYSIDKNVALTIKPNESIEIRNPGAFRKYQLIEDEGEIGARIPVRRIIPDAKPRNPRLARVLAAYSKWEGKGIGMATLVNLCLENRIDLPYYRFYSESDLGLFLRQGKLLDAEMESLFNSCDAYIHERLGDEPSLDQKLTLAYLIKSERDNELYRWTILLTPDNNHFRTLLDLEKAGLIYKHPATVRHYPVYAAEASLARQDFSQELKAFFSERFDALNALEKSVLNVVYRHNRFSMNKLVSAKNMSSYLYFSGGDKQESIREFDRFYRQVRRIFNKLEKTNLVVRTPNRGYEIAGIG